MTVMDTRLLPLRGIALFADLSDDALARVADAALRRAYESGEVIIFEGDPCEAAYFIAKGQVRVSRLAASGREQVLARLGSGQAFNTVPPFRPGGINHATVEALAPVVLYVVSSADLRRLVGECPELALALLQDFAGRLDHLTDLVEDLSLRTVRGRLARFLLEHGSSEHGSSEHGSSEHGGTVGDGTVTRRWTQDEIAAHIGTVRDMVGRTLRAFVDAGLMEMRRQRIVLLDREGLEKETQG